MGPLAEGEPRGVAAAAAREAQPRRAHRGHVGDNIPALQAPIKTAWQGSPPEESEMTNTGCLAGRRLPRRQNQTYPLSGPEEARSGRNGLK